MSDKHRKPNTNSVCLDTEIYYCIAGLEPKLVDYLQNSIVNAVYEPPRYSIQYYADPRYNGPETSKSNLSAPNSDATNLTKSILSVAQQLGSNVIICTGYF